MLVPIILSGGDGTRLWPASRKSLPKQFVKLVDPKKSLLQAAVERIKSLKIEHSGLVVVCGENHRFLLAEQLYETNVNLNKIILEPIARNTAPAIALAAIDALNKYPTAKLLIQTADHIIPDLEYFNQQIIKAIKANFPIITFGVKPTRSETGFGYIKLGKKINNSCLFKVNKFIEKPDYKKAQALIREKDCLWNSGMFLIDAKT